MISTCGKMASAKIIELDETNTCKICDNAFAKYSCPKCNILYCSLDCYQSNSHLECSETFYKANILEELNLNKNDSESKEKMLQILKRFHEGNQILSDGDESSTDCSGITFEDILNLESFSPDELDSDDNEEELLDIGERLAGINLDDAEKVWEKLTETERQDFVSFLKSEDIANLIPSWQPWWLYHSKKVEVVEESEEYKNNCPKLCDIKDFSALTSKTPAVCIKYNLINILTAYAFTVRYFNGEHFDFPKESVSCMVTISLTLKRDQKFEDFETAVKSVEMECVNSDWIVSDSENIQTMRQDINNILNGPKKSDATFYILCALSDLKNLLVKSLQTSENDETTGGFSKQFTNDHFPSVKLEEPDKVKHHVKKIDYFLSYAKDKFEA
ncbi:zinc finger HIT domain-containing protein 2 [Diorhabda sublineata]|uniref:zinc finger HIT domain-containing protein 2 n=1 Tax=Diorhabda sublineata TaxID=1163346 RepID=UPI0024E060EF|nr:zinc finger HIT domain-containing protein 2 [Diorhabda sublineata]